MKKPNPWIGLGKIDWPDVGPFFDPHPFTELMKKRKATMNDRKRMRAMPEATKAEMTIPLQVRDDKAPPKVDAKHVFDHITRPSHYVSHPSGIECITVTEHMNFCRGNAMKYLWRAGEKGDEIQDLEKAAWYILREIDRLKTKKQERLDE